MREMMEDLRDFNLISEHPRFSFATQQYKESLVICAMQSLKMNESEAREYIERINDIFKNAVSDFVLRKAKRVMLQPHSFHKKPKDTIH